MEIRPASPDDAPGIARMHKRAWDVAFKGLIGDEVLARRSYDVERYREHIVSGSQQQVVAQVDGVVIGWLSQGPCEDEDVESAWQVSYRRSVGDEGSG